MNDQNEYKEITLEEELKEAAINTEAGTFFYKNGFLWSQYKRNDKSYVGTCVIDKKLRESLEKIKKENIEMIKNLTTSKEKSNEQLS